MKFLILLAALHATGNALVNPQYMLNARVVGVRCEVRPGQDTGVVTIKLPEKNWAGRDAFTDVKVDMTVCSRLFQELAPAIVCSGAIHADFLTSDVPGGRAIVNFWNVQANSCP